MSAHEGSAWQEARENTTPPHETVFERRERENAEEVARGCKAFKEKTFSGSRSATYSTARQQSQDVAKATAELGLGGVPTPDVIDELAASAMEGTPERIPGVSLFDIREALAEPLAAIRAEIARLNRLVVEHHEVAVQFRRELAEARANQKVPIELTVKAASDPLPPRPPIDFPAPALPESAAASNRRLASGWARRTENDQSWCCPDGNYLPRHPQATYTKRSASGLFEAAACGLCAAKAGVFAKAPKRKGKPTK